MSDANTQVESAGKYKYPYTFEPTAMLRLTGLGMMALKALNQARLDRLAARGGTNLQAVAQHLTSHIGPGNIVTMTEEELDMSIGPLLDAGREPLVESEIIPNPPLQSPIYHTEDS